MHPNVSGSEVLLCWVGSRFQHPTNLCSTIVHTRRPGSVRTDCQKVSSRTVKVCCDGLARVFSKLRHGVASVGTVGLARHCVSVRPCNTKSLGYVTEYVREANRQVRRNVSGITANKVFDHSHTPRARSIFGRRSIFLHCEKQAEYFKPAFKYILLY